MFISLGETSTTTGQRFCFVNTTRRSLAQEIRAPRGKALPLGFGLDAHASLLVSPRQQTELDGSVLFMPTSQFQSQVKERLITLLKGYGVQENVRPDWLINPKTGRRLELDLYLDNVKIAIEVQGGQHTHYVPWMHASEAAFESQQERDDFKRAICKQRGVFLYEVYKVEDIEGFIEAAKSHCPEMAFELYKKWAAMRALQYYSARLYEAAHQHRHIRQQTKVDSLRVAIEHLCDKYNIDPSTIKPDFTMRKSEMGFLGAVRFRAFQDHGTYNADLTLAIKSIERNTLTGIFKGGETGQGLMQFDLTTGKQITENTRIWFIELDHPKTVEALAEFQRRHPEVIEEV